MKQEFNTTPFITFYSFKGGVGRSMALINTAAILAGRGFRVLVVDMDLEAPGLSYLADESARANAATNEQPGIIDLLSDAKQRGPQADLFALTINDVTARYTQRYPLPENGGDSADGALYIMPAGKLDDGYTKRFDELNLPQLYAEGLGEPLIRVFKKKISESGLYDYVLIDSRTGFSDEAGICTRDLADYLMIFSGLNNQNIAGTCAFLKSLKAASGGEAAFQIILSPVPTGEDELLEKREQSAKEAFSAVWGRDIDLSLQIPYHPRLALTEEPYVFKRKRGYLIEAYRAIEARMLGALGHDEKGMEAKIRDRLKEEDYVGAMHMLARVKRLDDANGVLNGLMMIIVTDRQIIGGAVEKIPGESKTSLKHILGQATGYDFISRLIDQIQCTDDILLQLFLGQLWDENSELTGKLLARMLEANQNDANFLGNYAVFLETKRGDLDAAQQFYQRALEADPANAYTLCDHGQFLIGNAKLLDGEQALLSSIANLKATETLALAACCFALWLATQMQHKDASKWQQGYKFYLQQGFARRPRTFERMLNQAKTILAPDEFRYAQALAAAFLDAGQVSTLDQYEQWRTTEAQPVKPNNGN